MRRSILVLFLGLALAGCGSGEEAGGEPQPPQGAPPGGAGFAAIEEAGCLACHSIGGRGNPGAGGTLDGVGARLSRERIATVIREGEGTMPAYGGLPPERLEAMVDYLASLR